jgi:pimeloyl-ACP methyl ester carboxylesterase
MQMRSVDLIVAAEGRRERQLRRGEVRELESVWTEVGGCRMHARWGGCPAERRPVPVVLVHGFGISSSYFVPAAERLATEFAVYAPDLPGHGKSDTPREPLDIPRLADALVGWMDAVGLRRACLVANSMGCQVVVDAAVRYPERVDRLVLIAPATDPAARNVVRQAWRLLLDARHERFSLIPLLIMDYLRMGLRLIPESRFMLRDRIEDKLPHVSAPVLLVGGQKDPIVPQGWVEAAARLVPSARLIIIPGWGHAPHYSAPRVLVDAVAPFLRGAAEEGNGTEEHFGHDNRSAVMPRR